jgi:multidrug efflux pump subunit AcrA (membrane-fusion protein)
LIENLPARVQAYRISEIRPQVGGIIEKVLFTQGSEVKAGQPYLRSIRKFFKQMSIVIRLYWQKHRKWCV